MAVSRFDPRRSLVASGASIGTAAWARAYGRDEARERERLRAAADPSRRRPF